MKAHDVDWHKCCEVVAIFVYPMEPSAAILDFIEPQLAPFNPPTLKTVAWTKHGVDRMHRLRDIRV